MIQSLSELLCRIKEDSREWGYYAYYCRWFRGIKQSNLKLSPFILRDHHSYDEVTITNMFVRQASNMANILSNDYERWLYLMQHHGLPTRLLDWTESLSVAIYFALYEITEVEISDDKIAPPCIWMLYPFKLNELSIKRASFPSKRHEETQIYLENFKLPFEGKKTAATKLPVALKPYYIHDRMIRQKSTFTIHGTDNADFEALFKDSLIKDGYLKRYEIDKSRIKEIFQDVQILGTTHFNIFPDLDGLAAELKMILA